MDELIRMGKTEDGELVVTSRQVAEDFGKRHSDVLRTIEDKMKVNEILRSPKYFIESTYIDKSNRQSKEYLLTRDGFSFIVMGFNGKRADEWKLKYIEAFNRMEKEINELLPIIAEQRKQIVELTNNVKRIEECVGIRSKTVFDYTKYIKRKLGIRKKNNDYENIKQCIFYEFHVTRWEQLTYDDKVMNRIDEICERVSHRKERKLF